MRIDLEHFLAATMTLGTVGAIGFAVYTHRGDDEPVTESAGTPEEPEARPEPDVVATSPAPAEPAAIPAPAEPPPLPEEPDADFLRDPALDGIAAPHVEGFG